MAKTILDVWLATVKREPGAIAVITDVDGRTWTRAQLAQLADDWMARIPGSRTTLARRKVAMAVPNGPGWWEAFIGLMQMGAVPVLIDISEPVARRLEIARSVAASALWSEGQWVSLSAKGRRLPSETCLVKLTSGSTGKPRARLFTHAQILADGRQVCATMGIRPDDRNLALVPLGHSYGLGNLVVPLLQQGTAMVCADSPLPNALGALCARWHPTVFPAVPTVLDVLSRSEVPADMLQSLRLVISAGAALPPALATAFAARFGRKVHNFYGASETGGISYDRSGDSTATGRSVGTPLQGVKLRWIRGQRFSVESPAVTGKGRFSPADRGVLNEQGELTLLGRVGRTVKLAARRLDLGEIEQTLREIDGVQAAYAMIDPARPDSLVAAVAATHLSAREVKLAMQVKVSAWKVPQRIVVLPRLPHTPRGKIDIRKLAPLLAAKPVKPTP